MVFYTSFGGWLKKDYDGWMRFPNNPGADFKGNWFSSFFSYWLVLTALTNGKLEKIEIFIGLLISFSFSFSSLFSSTLDYSLDFRESLKLLRIGALSSGLLNWSAF